MHIFLLFFFSFRNTDLSTWSKRAASKRGIGRTKRGQKFTKTARLSAILCRICYNSPIPSHPHHRVKINSISTNSNHKTFRIFCCEIVKKVHKTTNIKKCLQLYSLCFIYFWSLKSMHAVSTDFRFESFQTENSCRVDFGLTTRLVVL